MKIRIIYIALILLSQSIYGQSDMPKAISVLRENNNVEIRRKIVDSIIDNCFWDSGLMSIPYSLLSKGDFSEKSKNTLLSYFTRELPVSEIKKVELDCLNRMERDSTLILIKAEREGISDSVFFNKEMKESLENDIQNVNKRARSSINPLYARILGWLEYKPAIQFIESVLEDRIKDPYYSYHNRKELIHNCKLALARLGNTKYEQEILSNYERVKIDCLDDNFERMLNDLFYINTQRSINYAIKLANNDSVYRVPYMYGFFTECSAKEIILLSLYRVIDGYPLRFEYEDIADTVMIFPRNFASEPFYEVQYKALLYWLKDNRNKYKINRSRFFYTP